MNVIKLSHLFTIWPPLLRPPSTLCPLSLLLSVPLYHSFKIVVVVKPLANVSMSLSKAGQQPASQLPPGCSLIDSPLLSEWQAALVRPWRPVWQLVVLVSPCVGPHSAHWALWISQLEAWAALPEPSQSSSPGVLIVADQLVSFLQPVYHLCSKFLLHIRATKEVDVPPPPHIHPFFRKKVDETKQLSAFSVVISYNSILQLAFIFHNSWQSY